MVSFYPGPSRVYDDIPRWTTMAASQGILSMNHRSDDFMKLMRNTIQQLHKKLSIPSSYSIFFVSSATECWEIIAQSLIDKESLHIINGAFGEKWFDYTKRLKPDASKYLFDREALPAMASLQPPVNGLICITHNETSNGTALPVKFLQDLRAGFPSHVIAVDATSSMAGVYLDFRLADVWFASVQKCFGLPAGMAILICSPKAMERAWQLSDKQHYNSLLFMKDMLEKHQTTHTPNVLGIYLLFRSLQKRKPIREIDRQTRKRANAWYDFFADHRDLHLLITHPAVRSQTVIAVSGDPMVLQRAKKKAKQAQLLLGDGYGSLKPTTIRIANFPAIRALEIRALEAVLSRL